MTAPAKAAPMREDVTQALEPCPFCKSTFLARGNVQFGHPGVECRQCGAIGPTGDDDDDAEARWNAHTARPDAGDWAKENAAYRSDILWWSEIARGKGYDSITAALEAVSRPDAGDDKAEIERLRGLLIDPGSPPWEDARAVLVTELRKEGFDRYADYVAAAQGCMVPSDIALNLIAQAARRPDAGDEDVERVACAIYNEDSLDGLGESTKSVMMDRARAALAAMREGVDRGMVEVPREPSEAMFKAARKAHTNPHDLLYSDFAEIYRAMIEAAALEQPR